MRFRRRAVGRHSADAPEYVGRSADLLAQARADWTRVEEVAQRAEELKSRNGLGESIQAIFQTRRDGRSRPRPEA